MLDNSSIVHGYAEMSPARTLADMVFPAAEEEKKAEPDMANKVYQMLFAGLNGSTFPVGYFPVRQWNSIDVLSTITDAVEVLHQHGFTVSKYKFKINL